MGVRAQLAVFVSGVDPYHFHTTHPIASRTPASEMILAIP
jgi:hypothetical protein